MYKTYKSENTVWERSPPSSLAERALDFKPEWKRMSPKKKKESGKRN